MGEAPGADQGQRVEVLTPRTVRGVIGAGYVPRVHGSVQKGEWDAGGTLAGKEWPQFTVSSNMKTERCYCFHYYNLLLLIVLRYLGRTQNPVGLNPCRFESDPRHSSCYQLFPQILVGL